MAVTLTQPVAGQDRDSEYSGPMEDWLIANGYAKASDGKDKVNITGVKADKDPTLAANREEAGEELALFGEDGKIKSEKPVEDGSREAEPVPFANVPGIGDTEDDELTETREKLDGRVDEVKKGQVSLEKASTRAAEKSAGTGDNLLDEPTTDTALIKDAPDVAPMPVRRRGPRPRHL